MSALAVIVYRHLHIEKLNSYQLISKMGVFQEAEKRLHECSAAVDLGLPLVSNRQCCFIERSSPSASHSYFRISVHVVDKNSSITTQSRQQNLIRLKTNPQTGQIEKREFLSWREILDPHWDKEIDQSTNTPWELITPCPWRPEVPL